MRSHQEGELTTGVDVEEGITTPSASASDHHQSFDQPEPLPHAHAHAHAHVHHDVEAISSLPPPIVDPATLSRQSTVAGGEAIGGEEGLEQLQELEQDGVGEGVPPASASIPFHPQLQRIFVYLFLHATCVGIMALAVPQFLLGLYHDDASRAAFVHSLISTLAGVLGLFAYPTIGMLSDHYGRKPFILLALVGSTAGFLLLGTLNNLTAIIAAASIRGCTDVSYTIAFAVLGDVTPKSFFLSTYGRLSSAGALGLVFGPLLALACFQIEPLRLSFLLATVLEAGNIAWVATQCRETLYWFDRETARAHNPHAQLPTPVRESLREMFARRTLNPFKALRILGTTPALWVLAFALFLQMVAYSGMISVFYIFTHRKFGWKATQNAINILVLAVCTILANAALLPWLLKKRGVTEQRLLGVSLACTLVQNLTWAFVPASMPWVVFIATVVLMPSLLMTALLRGLISRQVEPNKQGELQGGLTCLVSLAGIVGPLTLNSLFSYFVSDAAPFAFPGAPFFFVFCLNLVIAGLLAYVSRAHLAQMANHAYTMSPTQDPRAIEPRERTVLNDDGREEEADADADAGGPDVGCIEINLTPIDHAPTDDRGATHSSQLVRHGQENEMALVKRSPHGSPQRRLKELRSLDPHSQTRYSPLAPTRTSSASSRSIAQEHHGHPQCDLDGAAEREASQLRASRGQEAPG